MGFVISHVMGNADLGWVYTVVKIKRPKKLRRGESGWVFLRCRNWKKGRDGAGAAAAIILGVSHNLTAYSICFT